MQLYSEVFKRFKPNLAFETNISRLPTNFLTNYGNTLLRWVTWMTKWGSSQLAPLPLYTPLVLREVQRIVETDSIHGM